MRSLNKHDNKRGMRRATLAPGIGLRLTEIFLSSLLFGGSVLVVVGWAVVASVIRRVEMGKPARVGLLLGATSCLLAVMIDWVVGQLRASPTVSES